MNMITLTLSSCLLQVDAYYHHYFVADYRDSINYYLIELTAGLNTLLPGYCVSDANDSTTSVTSC